MTTIDDIRERLTEIRPTGQRDNIVGLGMVQGVDSQNGAVTIHLAPAALAPPILQATIADIRRAVGALEGITAVEVRVQQPSQQTQSPYGELGPIPGVRDIIAVSSTKGGVGKSTVAANLALALQHCGRRVGLLDSDVYGPSMPLMLGISGRPRMGENKRIFPIEKFGLRVMSMGFFLDDSSPVIWRGPMVMGLVRQFLKDVEWGELDILVVDMPPGTGDAQLTLVQQVPLAGGVIVTTPQDVALLDVERGIAMFQQVNTPVLGVVENMSYYQCDKCGRREDVFGTGGGSRIAERFGVPLLGAIPLIPAIREGGDAGTPIVIAQPQHAASKTFLHIASQVLDAVEAGRAEAAAPRIIG
ncbi:MAG: Mrp/NBP35 family ATP-binding protein [Deltaproteobacteria bacterium]|nr:Mrp/NBP35 family ATP-binding protein [Deltaproteobacteria bacterium]MBI3386694.1 Mrp/NBP35 family ATP-binding protein [Deltaproteobacteria bacterium]